MTKTKKRATPAEAMSFAHLLPLNPGASARAEDDDDKDKGPDAEDGEDEDGKKPAGKKAKKARADDQGNDDGEDDGADGDGDEDGADADDGENDDGDGEDDKKPAGKKAKKARADDKDGDGEDDEKEDGPSARAGAMRERRRCAAIFGSRHAAGRPDLAAHLAFNTTMSAAEAIGTMKTLVGGEKAGARSARSTLADRMQAESVPNPGQGAGTAPTGPKGLAAAMIAASKKAQGAGA
ncbi:hypothetical protein [Acidisoma sp. 7E03]